MVAQFLGLKLRLMANMFRRSPWQVFGLAIGLLYGLGITAVVVISLVVARFVSDVALLHNILVVVGSAVIVGFLLLPLVFGVDDTLDPRRFSLFGIPTTRLAAGLALAALIGIPSLVLSICALATVVTWSRDPGSALFALIGAALIVGTCVLAARVSTSIASFLLATRRAREFGGVIGILLIVMISPVVVLLVSVYWARDGAVVLREIAAWLSWTPLGAVWSMPGAAAEGQWGAALLQLLVALATLGVLWLGWRALVGRMLVTPQREAVIKDYRGLGWFDRLPGRAAGAVAARSITYWGRDVRYWVALVMIPLMPVLMVVALLVAGMPGHYVSLLPLPVMCLFLGWTLHNDVAYDSTAIWLHVASGVSGFADRIGRIFPVILFGIPLIAVGSIVTVSVYGSWSLLPAVVGVSTSVLLIGVGLSSVSSALFPYPATKPGESAFTQPQTSGGSAAIVQSVSFFAILALSAPAIVFMILGVFVDPAWLSWALIAGVGVGLLAVAAGVYFGAVLFERRGPEIMAFATRND